MKRAAIWAGLLVSGVFAWLAVRDVDFGRVADALGAVTYWWLAPALGALAVAIFLRGARWQALFAPEVRPPLASVLRAMMIGNFFNLILPARAGEGARVLALPRETSNSRAEVLATAVAERVIDVLMLLVLLFVAAPFLPKVSWLGKAVVLAAILAAAMVVAAVLLTRYGAGLLTRYGAGLLARWVSTERAELAVANLVRGLAVFRRPSVAWRGLVLTLLSWLGLALSGWFLLRGFQLGVGFGGALLVVIATNLVLVLPSTPGAVGPFEAGAVVALSAYGINKSSALSFGIVLHALNIVPILAVGYASLHWHLIIVRRRAARIQNANEADCERTRTAHLQSE